MEYTYSYSSPIGNIFLAGYNDCLTGLWIESQKYCQSTLDNKNEKMLIPVFEKAMLWLDEYFDGKNPKIDFNLKPKGSDFRQKVWAKLLEIPYGEITTYGNIAKSLENECEKKVSAQAVGGAIGHNPISIIIPCHRIIASNGKLTGYAGGIDKKLYLIGLENKENIYKIHK